MKPTVYEPGRDLPVEAHYDVVVVGGGIAGVAAALAVKRQGASVVLIEKQFGLGGLATLGNVIVYLPICDGNGRKVMGGIAEELLHLSVAELKNPVPKARFVPVPDCWLGEGSLVERSKKRFMTSFNPFAFQMAMERVLDKEGVEIMYDTRVCQIFRDGPAMTHVIVENKSGRMAISGGAFIDASGDADLCYLAGCKVEVFPNNVLNGWHYEIHNGELRVVIFSNPYDKEHGRGNNAKGPFFDGTNHKDVTRQIIESRKLINERYEKKNADPEVEAYPIGINSIPGFRVTRRLHNAFSLGECHRHVWLEDTVGFTSDWRRRGPVYPITLNSMQADDVRNLFAVGRCLSADSTLVDVTRAIPTCAVSGEAAGIAAVMLVREQYPGGNIPVDELRQKLIEKNNVLDPELLKEAADPIEMGGPVEH
jgi:hypothetical protein